MRRRKGGWHRVALAIVAEGAAAGAIASMRIAELFVKVADWAREEARREHCHLCKMGSSAARASCWKRTNSFDRCADMDGASADA